MIRTTWRAAFANCLLSSGFIASTRCFLCFISLVLFHASAIAADVLDRTISLDIAPDSALEDALIQWGAQAGLQVMMDTNETGHEKTGGIHGTFRAADALSALLSGSGLVYKVTDHTVTVTQAGHLAPDIRLIRTAETVPGVAPESPGKNGAAPSGSSDAGALHRDGTDEKKRDPNGLLDLIVVTGTHIRDSHAQSSPVTVLDRESFEAQGADSVQSALAHLPSNFQGDVNIETASQAGGIGNSQTNRGGASSPNIHGLGSSSTLSVMNGNRLPTGSQGVSVDISMLPQIAIDHIDVLRDGASPIYGADAVAGVVNFVTRHGYDGEETSVRYGEATSGGLDQVQVAQAVGRVFQAGSIFSAFQYDHNSSIVGGDREATAIVYPAPATAYPAGRQYSGYANGYLNVSSATTLYGEALYADRQSTAVLDYGAPVFVTAARENRELVGNTGFDSALGDDWHLKGTAQYAFNTLDDSVSYDDNSSPPYEIPYRETDYGASFVTNGRLFELPAGSVEAAFGIDYRHEGRSSAGSPQIEIGSYRLARNVAAGFGELAIPLLSGAQQVPLIQSLELTAAVRYDHYGDFGGTTNPKLGLVWQIDDALRIRANYSTSFRAPSFAEENLAESYYVGFTVPDPVSRTGSSNVIYLSGGNPNLKPEKARTASIGADLMFKELSGLQAHIDFFRVDFTDRISSPDPAAASYGGLEYPPIQPFLDRNPSPAYVTSLVSSPLYAPFYSMPFDRSNVVVADNRLTNLSENLVTGLDLSASLDPRVGLGNLRMTWDATFFSRFDLRFENNDPLVNYAGTVFFPPKVRLRGGALWSVGPWQANAFINYTGGFTDARFSPTVDVASLTTADVILAYDTKRQEGRLSNLRVSVIGGNVFNRQPPFIRATQNQGFPIYDPTNASIVGRTVALQVTKQW